MFRPTAQFAELSARSAYRNHTCNSREIYETFKFQALSPLTWLSTIPEDPPHACSAQLSSGNPDCPRNQGLLCAHEGDRYPIDRKGSISRLTRVNSYAAYCGQLLHKVVCPIQEGQTTTWPNKIAYLLEITKLQKPSTLVWVPFQDEKCCSPITHSECHAPRKGCGQHTV